MRQTLHFDKPIVLQKGGETRFQSVKNGLDENIKVMDWLQFTMVFDRWSMKILLVLLSACGCASIRCSLCPFKRINSNDRSGHHESRGPFPLQANPNTQTFQVELIRKAYESKEDPSLTDDASVAERAGHLISLFEGSYENIKITTPEDLIIAEALLKNREEQSNESENDKSWPYDQLYYIQINNSRI